MGNHFNNHNIDYDRESRTGFTEVVYCQGKPDETLVSIFENILNKYNSIIGTRASISQFQLLNDKFDNLSFNENAKIIYKKNDNIQRINGKILIVSAGSADFNVAEEAALTCELLGCNVSRAYDNGIAGIHRIIDKTHDLNSATIIIAVAGMEGALPSVVAGLTDAPVIAVPTSIGYGASFGGISPLLTMLNSCASGISVVNIDNGFGAAMMAAKILKKTMGYVK